MQAVQQGSSPALDSPPLHRQHPEGQQDPLRVPLLAGVPPSTAPVVQDFAVAAGASARADGVAVAAAAAAAIEDAGVDGGPTGAVRAPAGVPDAPADAVSTGSVRTSTSGATDAATSSVTNSNSSSNTDSTSSTSCSSGAEEAGAWTCEGPRHTAQGATEEAERACHVPSAQRTAAAVVPPLPPVTTGLPEQQQQQQALRCFAATATGGTDVGESEGRDGDGGCTAAARVDCCCAPGAEGCGVKVALQTCVPAPSTPRNSGRSVGDGGPTLRNGTGSTHSNLRVTIIIAHNN